MKQPSNREENDEDNRSHEQTSGMQLEIGGCRPQKPSQKLGKQSGGEREHRIKTTRDQTMRPRRFNRHLVTEIDPDNHGHRERDKQHVQPRAGSNKPPMFGAETRCTDALQVLELPQVIP